MMRAAGDDSEGTRLRGLIVVLWRAGLRVSEALALAESDLDAGRGAILVRHGKGGKRREVGMDRWAWDQLTPWLALRATLPVGALFCILRGPTRGRPCAPAGVRTQLRAAAARAGVRAPLRAASAAPCARGRNVARGCPASGHSASARARRSRDHLRLSSRHRQHRDRPYRARTPSADDPRPQPTALRPLSSPRTSPRQLRTQVGPRRAAPRPRWKRRPKRRGTGRALPWPSARPPADATATPSSPSRWRAAWSGRPKQSPRRPRQRDCVRGIGLVRPYRRGPLLRRQRDHASRGAELTEGIVRIRESMTRRLRA